MSFRIRYSLTALCLSAATLFAASNTASAIDTHVKFCNHTRIPLELAWGYDAHGGSQTISEGWQTVAVCACEELFHADLKATEFWVLAVKSGTFEEATNGTGPLCVHPKNRFTFVKQNNSRESCHNAGGKWLKFAQGNTEGKKHHTTTLGNRCNQ